MSDIRHRVVIDGPLSQVYEAIATRDGLSEWWTRGGVEWDSTEGSEISFFFGQPEPAAVMVASVLDPSGAVAWRCVGGADEWVGTELSFELRETDGGTAVLFTHAKWRDPGEFMAHCSARWAYFLLSLKSYVEHGRGTPFPEDLKF